MYVSLARCFASLTISKRNMFLKFRIVLFPNYPRRIVHHIFLERLKPRVQTSVVMLFVSEYLDEGGSRPRTSPSARPLFRPRFGRGEGDGEIPCRAGIMWDSGACARAEPACLPVFCSAA